MNATAERALAQAYTDAAVGTTNTNVTANTAAIAALTPVAGATGQAVTVTKYHTGLTDNTATDSLGVTIPNTTGGGAIKLTVAGTLGDGDASDIREYTVAVSRIAGAAALAAISSAALVGGTTGATANSTSTLTITSVTGSVGASNSFKIQVKVAHSAGTASNHWATVRATAYPNLLNQVVVTAL